MRPRDDALKSLHQLLPQGKSPGRGGVARRWQPGWEREMEDLKALELVYRMFDLVP